MSEVFYAKGPGNEGYIENLDVLGFNDLGGGSFGQMQLWHAPDGRYLLDGTMHESIGIVDVTDPTHTVFLKRFPVFDRKEYPTTTIPKLQIADGLMICAASSGSGPALMKDPPHDKAADKCLNGVCIYSLKEDPENPKFLSYWDNGVPWAMGVHRFMYNGGRYVHLSSDAVGFEGMIYRILDIEDPRNPKEVGRWWHPEQFADGFPGRTFDPGAKHCPEFMDKNWLHGPPYVRGDYAYLGYSGAGMVILDVSDVTRPKCVGELPLMPAFCSERAGARTHTCLPLPGRDFCVVTNEGERYVWIDPAGLDRPQAMNNLHMVDVSDPSCPTLVAEFPYPKVPANFPYQNFNTAWLGKQGPFGPHNIHEPMSGKPWLEQRGDLVYCCYFAAGLRVFDVSDPYYIKELAYFIPPNPPKQPFPTPGPQMAITEDLVVDNRGNIIIDCAFDGIYILRMKNK